MSSIWSRNNGLYLGYQQEEFDKPNLLHELSYQGDRHLISVGPNGVGKTRRLALVNACRLLDWSLLIVDTKGSITTMTRALRKAHGCEEVILNPADLNNLR